VGNVAFDFILKRTLYYVGTNMGEV